ncbi:PAS domain-containing protein [Anoxybacillus sp. LAT_35]|uniref:two-component system histidine kinase PnpS n=1 Tax=Anoxybacillus TaxID=150247 RepID=UPI001EDB3DC0|nr:MULTISPECIES: ATP-binding protein [Anoxybacillus]MCG5024153.1 ATP-binding protein [Anoxybacillus flavithermus]MCG6198834.1 PAS domain-containing protein [Anoxybacillus sp. LAT_38]MCG3086151.1 PAS domain-containing protein [Anoxybacillus sp. LAT27]MCG6172942.1 PAS domain-containing protein [Anoxybacillus sp. LAT_11]MCG6173572.1 PAS domain-containing protein [Anoxybacillus sp. LAT_11]
MNKFRSRLLIGLVSVILSVLFGLGLLLGQLFQKFYADTVHDRIEKEAKLLALYMENKSFQSNMFKQQLHAISDMLSARITIVDREGQIMFDTNNYVSIDEKRHKTFIRTLLKQEDRPVIFQEEQNVYYYAVPFWQRDQKLGHIVMSLSMDAIERVDEQIWLLLTLSLSIAFFIILLLGIKITNQYTKPIEAATKVAMELARGNYKARTYESREDETGMLSQSLNILARNLQEMVRTQEMQQDRLRALIENIGSGLILIDQRGYISLMNRAYKEMFHIDPSDYVHRLYYEAFPYKEVIALVEEIFMTEVNVRKQMLLPIDIERKHFEVYGTPIIGTNDEWKGIIVVFHDITELKKLEQMRKDFVANVSHELKTPITSIKGFAETLLDGAMHDAKTLEYFLTIILKESERLQHLIQDLLDLSKIEQQGFTLNISVVDLHEVLKEVIVMLEAKANDKQITLECTSNAPLCYMYGDLHRLKQIFINLINNAIAYTPAGGRVTVYVEKDDKELHVHVSDTGIGIEQKEIPRIFERFYRVDKARSRNSGGTGLGLAIVKHLVEAHHGTISVKSEVGIGTTFTVHFRADACADE